MQRNSPNTVIRVRHTKLVNHHQNVWGTWPLTIQHPIKWKRCTVAVKSRHCFVLLTTNQRPRALQNRITKNEHTSVILPMVIVHRLPVRYISSITGEYMQLLHYLKGHLDLWHKCNWHLMWYVVEFINIMSRKSLMSVEVTMLQTLTIISVWFIRNWTIRTHWDMLYLVFWWTCT